MAQGKLRAASLAYETARDHLSYQHIARQTLDMKLTAVFATSGGILAVLSAFASISVDSLSSGAIGLIVFSALCFVAVVLKSLGAFQAMPFISLTWENVEEINTSDYDEVEVLWKAARTMHAANNENEGVLRAKKNALTYTSWAFALQALALTAAALLTLSD